MFRQADTGDFSLAMKRAGADYPAQLMARFCVCRNGKTQGQ